MPPALSIVLPAYNEEANIERAVREAAGAARALVPDHEIVVVNDGSRDRTGEVLAGLAGVHGQRLVIIDLAENLGYGAALRIGLRAARGDLVFYTDSDNQFDLTELQEFLPLMKDCDAALGYRVDRQDTALRRLVSRGFNFLAWSAFGVRVRDMNCSF
jgi:glycosyltransferase involved in cell wall biosynthesis